MNKRVLVVDDDESFRRVLCRALQLAGYEVAAAADGAAALKAYEEQPAELVITDLIMPEKEGLELIMDLRRIQPPPSIIAISGGLYGNLYDLVEREFRQ